MSLHIDKEKNNVLRGSNSTHFLLKLSGAKEGSIFFSFSSFFQTCSALWRSSNHSESQDIKETALVFSVLKTPFPNYSDILGATTFYCCDLTGWSFCLVWSDEERLEVFVWYRSTLKDNTKGEREREKQAVWCNFWISWTVRKVERKN